MSKMTLSDAVKAAHARLQAAGVIVETNSSMSTVLIKDGDEELFMQGDEADDFCDQVEEYYNTLGDVTTEEVESFLAEPYLEVLS